MYVKLNVSEYFFVPSCSSVYSVKCSVKKKNKKIDFKYRVFLNQWEKDYFFYRILAYKDFFKAFGKRGWSPLAYSVKYDYFFSFWRFLYYLHVYKFWKK